MALRAQANSKGRVRTGSIGGLSGVPGQLFGQVFGFTGLRGGLTASLKGSVSAGAVLAGGLTLKRALVGAVVGGATFTSNLTGPGLPGVLRGTVPAGAAITGTPTLVSLVVASPAGTSFYVSEGDSITAGGGSQGTPYNALFAGTDATDITFSNQAVSGNQLADLVARASAVDALIASNPGKTNYNLSVLVGTNDAGINTAGYYPSNAAGFLTAYAAYLDARRAAGWDVTVFTILPRNNSSYDAWINTVNTGIRGFFSAGHADAVIDLYNAPVMGGFAASSNASLYYDGLHPTQLGHNYIERAMAAGLSARMTVAVAPTISSASITGTAQDGQLLTAVAGTITGHGAPTKAYQWKRSGTNISGATNSTYQLVTADVGSAITVTITVTNAGGSASATSAATATVAAIPAPVNSVAPVISGTATQGQVLTTTNGTWTNSPTSYTYAWKRDGVGISGATAFTYTLQGADVGANITCTVTAINGGGSTSATSNSLGPVASAGFLLDTTTATATAAYSTRKLRSAYAGSAIKVRRSSDNTAQDIGFDGSGNLDTAALATFAGSNSAFVDTWYDQSGNGNDISQATTAKQPRIRNAGTNDAVNGKAAPYWTTADAGMGLLRSTGFPSAGSFTLVGVFKANDHSANYAMFGGGNLGAGSYLLYDSAGVARSSLNGGNGATEGSVTSFSTLGTAPASYAYVRNTSGTAYDQILRAAGSQVLKQASYTISTTEIGVGTIGSGGTMNWLGSIPEAIVFASTLSPADLAVIDGSHSSYWGTTAGRFEDATMPGQTNYSAPTGYVVSASSEFNTGSFAAWRAFDHDKLSDFVSNATAATLTRQIPSAKTLTAYSVQAGGTTGASPNAPKTWTFEGSNDGSTWTVLDTVSTAQTGWADGERRVYPIGSGSRGSYTYHRLNVATSNGGSFFWIGEIEFITS